MGTHYKGKPAENRALDVYIKMRRAIHSVSANLERHLSSQGITESQFAVLEALLHLGPLCQTVLGSKILKSGANVTTVVDNLERRELVRRERSTEDRRFVTVYLTAEGRSLAAKVLPLHVARIVESFSALTAEEQVELDRLCKKLGLAAAQAG